MSADLDEKAPGAAPSARSGTAPANGTADAGADRARADRRRWPLKTLVEVLPVIIALTALFSWTSIRRVSDAPLVMLPMDVIGPAPAWMLALLAAVALVMFGGMGWLVYIYTRAPVNAEGPAERPFSPDRRLPMPASTGASVPEPPDPAPVDFSEAASPDPETTRPAELHTRHDGSQR